MEDDSDGVRRLFDVEFLLKFFLNEVLGNEIEEPFLTAM